jgi:inner membrane protein
VLFAFYGFLFMLLSLEDYSLLIGSVGLFAILAAVMFLTRRIDWWRITASGQYGNQPVIR